ncbi:MAG: hypothetical protein ACYC2H_06140 [Thermoplasmatota archaeon]
MAAKAMGDNATFFLAALAVLMLFWHPGVFINDEVAQVAGLHALRHGKLGLEGDLAPGYDPLLRWGFRHQGIPEPGEPAAAPIDSTMLNVLSLPGSFALEGTAVVLGYDPALALWQGLVVAAAVWAVLGRTKWGTSPWRWRIAALPGVLLLLGSAVRNAQFATEPFLELASIELTTMVLGAFAATLLFDLLKQGRDVRVAAFAAGALLIATPAFFWWLGNKDTGLSIALAVIAAWCYREGHRSSPLNTMLAFAVAGLAAWSHFQLGMLLVASLGVMALPTVTLGVAGFAKRASAGAFGLALGLWPYFVQGLLHDRFGYAGKLSDASQGALGSSVFADPIAVAEALARVLVWSDWLQTGFSLPLLATFPLLPLALFRARRAPHSNARTVGTWGLVYAVLLVAIGGSHLTKHGPGYDMRFLATVWPAVVVWTAPILCNVVDRASLGWVAKVSGLVAVSAFSMTLAFLGVAFTFAPTITRFGNLYDQVVVMRYAGMALGIALAYVGVLWAMHADRWQRLLNIGVAAALGLSIQFQLFLQWGLSRNWRSSAPFVAWPMELMRQLVEFLIFP